MMLVDDRTGGSRWTQFMLENIVRSDDFRQARKSVL